jgi:SAM-dependent methyltransferase
MMEIEGLEYSLADSPRVSATLRQQSAIEFAPDVHLQILTRDRSRLLYSTDLSVSLAIGWLPRGEYILQIHLHDLDLPQGEFILRMTTFSEQARQRTKLDTAEVNLSNHRAVTSNGISQPAWSVDSAPGTAAIENLAWNQGHDNWFFRHFDHAALVVTDYLLKKHPLLKGRILDVGCGDGIIDLGIFLRTQPEELVGIDPFAGFERLPDIIRDHHLPPELLNDPRLQFRADDGNDIPYPDDYFDVVVSWGSLEHIAGGYRRALTEIRRVLKSGGLFFVHPGLYYGALGNHLGEFFEDPFIHLKMEQDDLRHSVLTAQPRRMDRAGHVASQAEYWQWYTELNPIEVSAFEQELRQLGFEPWRAAVRTSDVIEYTPELQKHRIQDLATAELYLSAWNRK